MILCQYFSKNLWLGRYQILLLCKCHKPTGTPVCVCNSADVQQWWEMCSLDKKNQKEQLQNWVGGEGQSSKEIRASALNACGYFSMAAGILPAASRKKDYDEYTKTTESPYKLLAISQSTRSFQLLYPAFFKKKKKKPNKNVVTLLFWQDSEPGRLVGLPYIIGDLTNILPSIRLSHIEQSQHFCIGTIYPRVLE